MHAAIFMNNLLEERLSEKIVEPFFSKKQDQLYKIAFWSKAFAWIALIFYILLIIATFLADSGQYSSSVGTQGPAFIPYLLQNGAQLFSYLVKLGLMLVRGLAFFLVLKGISLGLYMIVETDINYRENAGGQNHAE